MLRIAICDDSPDSLVQTRESLEVWPDKPDGLFCEYFTHGDALIRAHTKNPFDVILLDIVMPMINGIESANEIRVLDKKVKIVFLTSSTEFAVESYSVKASNYLLKPVVPAALYRCLDELAAEINQNTQSILVKGTTAVHRIELNSIEYIEAQNKHVIFALSTGDAIEAVNPMYTYENSLLLDDGFFKCHRSYIVNIHHISSYTQKEIRMRSGCLIPISRNCHKEFESAFFSVIFGKAGADQ